MNELKRVLWLEDEPEKKPDVIEGLEWTFECKVDTAKNSEVFVSKLQESRVDLVLLDLRLPAEGSDDEIDPDYGFSALRSFLDHWNDTFCTERDVPVIVVSARFDDRAKEDSEQFDSIKYVVEKPFSYDTIVEKMNAAAGLGATPFPRA